jgi:CheY-like chemotaxis protein
VGSPIVLIVEDEPMLRGVTGEYLRLCGYAVVEVTDAAEAVRAESGRMWYLAMFRCPARSTA